MRVRKREILEGITHGRSGYLRGCGCDVCRKANSEYSAKRRAEKGRSDNVVQMGSSTRKPVGRPPKKRTESRDSVPGDMERAVISECAELPRATERPTLLSAARNMAKILDNPELKGLHNATTKQLMAILKDLHGDDDRAKATGRRKSGGRLATVGALTKVKRQGA
jgi:hypothetical protein